MINHFIPYNPKLVPYARELRKQGTLAEVILWVHLKKKQLRYDFHRQKPIGNYIVDFFCPELMLAIEIDGYSHIEKYQSDMVRQHTIEALGIAVLRFQENDIRKNIEGVLDIITEWIHIHT